MRRNVWYKKFDLSLGWGYMWSLCNVIQNITNTLSPRKIFACRNVLKNFFKNTMPIVITIKRKWQLHIFKKKSYYICIQYSLPYVQNDILYHSIQTSSILLSFEGIPISHFSFLDDWIFIVIGLFFIHFIALKVPSHGSSILKYYSQNLSQKTLQTIWLYVRIFSLYCVMW